jgi:hypothetical protein
MDHLFSVWSLYCNEIVLSGAPFAIIFEICLGFVFAEGVIFHFTAIAGRKFSLSFQHRRLSRDGDFPSHIETAK